MLRRVHFRSGFGAVLILVPLLLLLLCDFGLPGLKRFLDETGRVFYALLSI